MKIVLVLIFQILLTAGILCGQSRSIAITFDDLPGTHGNFGQWEYLNSKLLETLTRHKVPSAGFVNESKLYVNGSPDPDYVKLIENWLMAGMVLGNHTYSHVFIDQADIEEYKNEVMKGEVLLRPLLEGNGQELIYFRHTQLRTGPTEEYRQELNSFLDDKGYIIAPVTMDNDEYIYAYCYHEAVEKGDIKTQEWIKNDYLEYMEGIFEYYETISNDFLGYQVRQILLLHANLLNADTLNSLIEILESRGYSFITLGEALEDEAYRLPEVQSDRGISWLHRWMIARGVEPDNQPAVSGDIMELYNRYRNE